MTKSMILITFESVYFVLCLELDFTYELLTINLQSMTDKDKGCQVLSD